MFELMKILVERVFGLIDPSKLLEHRKTEKFSRIGADMFGLYAALNGIYVNGIAIISEIENALLWMDKKVNEGQPDSQYFSSIPEKLYLQKLALADFGLAFRSLAFELQVLNSDSFYAFSVFLDGKTGVLNHLQNTLSSTDIDVFSATKEEFDVFERTFEPFVGVMIRREPLIANMGAIPAYKADVLRHHLAIARPRENLETLKPHLDKLYDVLIANFTVRELLLKVGDKQLLRKGPFPRS